MLKTPNAKMLLMSLAKKGLIIKPPVDIDKIAQALGVQVVQDPLLENQAVISGIVLEKGVPTVKINPERNANEAKRRFTIAHSIGHYCLHGVRRRKDSGSSTRPPMHMTSSGMPVNSKPTILPLSCLSPMTWLSRKRIASSGSRETPAS